MSDPSAILASPWKTVPAGATPKASAEAIASMLRDEGPDRPEQVVVGIPRRLNGQDTDQTGPARAFAATLRDVSGLPVVEVDERLTSHEAEQRLGVRERDWRKRKAKLDAAAAAVILQDFLDQLARERPGV